MRRGLSLALVVGAIAMTSIATASADVTPSPTPTASPSATPLIVTKVKPVTQGLTPAQKLAIEAARQAFANAKKSAKDGFDRAVADAHAILDQAVQAAGKDKKAIAAANKDYKASFRQILDAYRSEMTDAKAQFHAAIAALKLAHPPTS